jgi:hypothetical protein
MRPLEFPVPSRGDLLFEHRITGVLEDQLHLLSRNIGQISLYFPGDQGILRRAADDTSSSKGFRSLGGQKAANGAAASSLRLRS